jgi:hypothetical protein
MRRAARTLRRAWPLAALSPLLATLSVAAPAPLPPLVDDYGEFSSHLVGEHPRVRTTWVDYTLDHRNSSWSFELLVDEEGVVTSADFKSGPREFRDEAHRAAQAVRFRPFERDGRPVRVRVALDVWSRPSDYAGPADRVIPGYTDPSSIVVALARRPCLGTCPHYRVELRGDGEVRYQGDGEVVVPGRHRWRIDPAKIAPLLDLFRRADYFKLDGFYVYPATDLPTYITRLSVGDRHKFVLNYGGSFGEAMASTRREGESPDMPPIVMEIEDAIDEVSGVRSFVEGDENTVPRLREERWNFRSRAAGDGLRMLLADCKTSVAREFIAAGAPVSEIGKGFGAALPISLAAYCDDIGLVRLMISRGALERRKDAESFLWSASGSGNVELVRLALKFYGNVRVRGEEGYSLLHRAAGSYANEGDPNARNFDAVKVIDALVAAGADPDARDDEGRTPLFEANEPEVVHALVRQGADPKVRDMYGRTPLFGEYFASTKAAFIAAGVDVNARSDLGRTALFQQGTEDAIKVLLDAGADLEITDSKGQTAIEQMNSEAATLVLLRAGARLPVDRSRLDAMIAKATERKWNEVLPLLTASSN